MLRVGRMVRVGRALRALRARAPANAAVTTAATRPLVAAARAVAAAQRHMSFLNLFGDKQSKPQVSAAVAPGTTAARSAAASPASAAKAPLDLLIIGGGSGGLALSREAAWLGASVGLADYVDPSPAGSTWGLGGTCVNVGCIPKKLYHTASLLGEAVHDAQAYGWELSDAKGQSDAAPSPSAAVKGKHNWHTLRDNIKAHIASSNFVYRVRLQTDGIEYFNARASFVDANTVQLTHKDGRTEQVRAKNIAIVVGGRPRPLNIPGAELAISSDDVFTLAQPPGKTLVIGASYVALECAGYLSGLGYDTTVMARSIVLRGFDQQMAELIVQHMSSPSASGQAPTRFLRQRVPISLARDPATRRIRVKFAPLGADGKPDLSKAETEVYDTVLSAVGRDAYLKPLDLAKVGVATDPKSGKIVVDSGERTSVPNVYALGDCVHNGLELTPVAIRAGKLLARRLYAHPSHAHPAPAAVGTHAVDSADARLTAELQNDHLQMRYEHVPTTVFTPIEYGCVGLSEEQARARYGDAIDVYHTHFQPLEWTTFTGRPGNSGYVKVITLRPKDLPPPPPPSPAPAAAPVVATAGTAAAPSAAQNAHARYWRTAHREQVLGLHYLGPNAGEVIQGYAVAFRKGMTRADLEETIAVHPTSAEEALLLTITKRSGVDPKKVGCCG